MKQSELDRLQKIINSIIQARNALLDFIDNNNFEYEDWRYYYRLSWACDDLIDLKSKIVKGKKYNETK